MGNLRQSQTKNTQTPDQSLVSGSRKPTYHPIEELQGIIGNRALGNLIKSQQYKSGEVHRSQDPLLSSVSPVSGQPIQRMPRFRGLSHELMGHWQQGNPVQAKLTIGEAGDKYELEADRVASEVVDRINAPVSSLSTQHQSIQAQGQQDELMRKPMVQLKSIEGGMAATPELETSIQQARGSGMPIAESIRKPMEQSFGADFSGVRVHADAQSDQLNQSIQARAFTTGKDIFFRQGEYNPGSQEGKKLIAHELTHVVQQTGEQIQCKSPSDSVPSSPTFQVHLERSETLQRAPSKKKYPKEEHPKKWTDSPNWLSIHDIPLEEATHDIPLEEATHDIPLEEATHDIPLEEATHDIPLEEATHDTPLEEATHDIPLEEATPRIKPEVLKQLGFGNKDVQKQFQKYFQDIYLKKRGVNKLLSINELNVIQNMAKDKEGNKYLKSLQMYSLKEAKEYLIKKSENDWLKLHPNQRIIVASVAWLCRSDTQLLQELSLSKEYLFKTRPYQMALHFKANQPGGNEYLDEIRSNTAEVWQNTLDLGEKGSERKAIIIEEAKKRQQEIHQYGKAKGRKVDLGEAIEKHTKAIGVLKKVFLLMQAGLKECTKIGTEGNLPRYQKWSENVATALSHGGRVNIVIPKLAKKSEAGVRDPYALLNWLGVTQAGKIDESIGAFKRSFGTHFMKRSRHEEKVREQGGKLAAIKNKFYGTELYGINLAVGGIGQTDFNSDIILPDGAHGHLLIVFRPPTTEKFGALEVGVETTAPGGASNEGYVHNWKSTEATANPLSSAGGAKAEKHGKGKLDWNRLSIVSLDEIDQTTVVAKEMENWLEKLERLKAFYDLLEKNERIITQDLVGKRDNFRGKITS
ncbi:MAG: DUF4157 domain-containing protein [Moorea sp. SIO4E2]|uniref:eCIS core domain-containing protein n=2 Tax=unclassified Moorena TaxID=2683338 RepID=UPI0013B64950|nr:DUF4157 domain-containing protein [Moorena sp. SIO4E2]NEQ09805.1 DUF4157 domain-containing protein [Moorena sp. SIO4E2]